MLRRNKKKEQPALGRASGGRGPHSDTNAYSYATTPPSNSQAPLYDPHHSPSSNQALANAGIHTSDQRGFQGAGYNGEAGTSLPSSGSVEAMPAPSSYPSHLQGPPAQPTSAFAAPLAQPQSIARTGGALGFIFSKAKNTFAGSSSQGSSVGGGESGHVPSGSLGSSSGMPHSSTSMASLASFTEDGDFQRIDARPSNFRGGPMSSPSKTTHHLMAEDGPAYRQHRPGLSETRQGSAPFSAAEPMMSTASSPPSKSFFSRDRKISASAGIRMATGLGTAGNGSANLTGPVYNRSVGGGAYGQFSRSQADLTSRRDFPSPASVSSEFTRTPQVSSSRAGGGNSCTAPAVDERDLLRSPSPHSLFSRSADDLNNCYAAHASSSSRGLGLRSPSPQVAGMNGLSPSGGGSLGLEALEEPDRTLQQPVWGTTADVPGRTLQPSSTHDSSRGVSPSGSKGDIATLVGGGAATSSQASQSPYPYPGRAISPSPEPKHSHYRTGSRHPVGGLSASFSLTNVAAGASNVLDKLRGPGGGGGPSGVDKTGYSTLPVEPQRSPSLPPGVVFQGLLNRNSNVSVPFSQLGGYNQREKDVSKGWKPYKVLLRDGQMFFYKPSSHLGDEAKDLFPSAIVKQSAASLDAMSRAYNHQTFDSSMLKQSGLGTQDLLNATQPRAGSTSTPLPRSPPTSPAKKGALPPLPDQIEEEASEKTLIQDVPSWHKAGKHPNLELTRTSKMPASWAGRIHSGTYEALVHEFVFATQLTSTDEPMNVPQVLQSVLYVALANGKTIQDFLQDLKGQLSKALKVTVGNVLHGKRSETEEEVEKFKDGVRNRMGRCVDLLIAHHADDLDTENAAMLEDLTRTTCGLGLDLCAALKDRRRGMDKDNKQDEGSHLATDWSRLPAGVARPKLASLAQGHFSASDLLSFEPSDVAMQIQIFHCDRLRALAVPQLWISRFAKPENVTDDTGSASPVSSIFGCSGAHPHYLTRLALDQILERNAASKQGFSASAAKHRAALLRHWIAIASYLLSFGDILGWVAIMAALCSRAVARLEHTWRYVAEGDRILHASSWTPKLAKLGWDEEGKTPFAGVMTLSAITSRQTKSKDGTKQQPVPVFGDTLYRISQVLSTSEKVDRLPIAALTTDVSRLYDLVNLWYTDGCQSQPLRSSAVLGISTPVKEFQQSLQALAAESYSTPSPPSVSSYLQTSFLLEPRGLGNLDLHWRQPLPPQLAAKAMVPLIFSEALPNLDLLNREDVANFASSGLSQPKIQGGSIPSADGTIRPVKYVRSPLGGTPLSGTTAWTSLRRSRTFPSSGSRSAKSIPFGDISEWTALTERGSAPFDAGTVFKIGSDLVLRATEDAQLSSSMVSPMLANVRFSQELNRGGSRPLSQTSKRSSLPASQRSSMAESFISSQVVIKAASLERLVDVLVLGVSDLTVALSDDNGEVPLQAGRRSKLSMDMHSFRTTFLATYRSICSPIVLFEFLRKRFLAAVNAAKEMASIPQGANVLRFPSWNMIPSSLVDGQGGHDCTDWDFVARVRREVISVLMLWASRYTQDFLDFPDLLAAFTAFVDHQTDILQGMEDSAAASEEDSDFPRVVSSLQDLVSTLRVNLLRVNTRSCLKIEGPPFSPLSEKKDDTSIDGKTAIERGDFDGSTALQIVEHLECVASVFFDKISEKDLLIVAELFERQAIDPLGWHAMRNQGSAEPQILTMYKLLESLPAQEVDKEMGPISQKLPASVRDACSAHSLLRGWVAVHIIEQRIGLQRRQARIEKLLDAIWICRARMLSARSGDTSFTSSAASAPLQDATVGSFVESVIIGSLTAPESRTFVRAWQGVCHARGGTGEGLEDLLPSRATLAVLDAVSSSPSTPDIGWLLRSIAQAVSRKSPLALTDSTLVDFERSQIVFNLIESSFAIRPTPSDQATAELASSHLTAMQTKLRRVHWDRRAFREEASREAAEALPLPTSTTYRAAKPLQRVTLGHAEKQQRDRAAFESLKRALKPVAAAGITTSSISSGTVTRSPGFGPLEIVGRSSLNVTSPSSAPAFAAEKRSRRVTALFRGAVRGTTGLIANNHSDKADRGTDIQPRSASSILNLISTNQKPAFVINLVGARVALWNNTQRSYTFHLAAQDGDCFLLQASGLEDLNEWMNQVSTLIRETFNNRGMASSQPESKRGGHANLLSKSKSTTITALTNLTPLYGVELNILVEKEGRPIPAGLERMLSVVESRGLKEQGIYRISGAKNSIEALKQAFSTQPPESVNLEYGEFSDVHTIAGAIKQWYRELPEPAIPYSFYHRIIAAEGIDSHDDRLYALRDIIWEFPRCHFDLLQRTAEHLGRVAEEAEYNKMLTHNLGLVFGTSLLNPPPSATSIAESFGSLGKAANVVKLIVTFHDWLFEMEAEPEAEVADEATETEGVDGDTTLTDKEQQSVNDGAVASSPSGHDEAQSVGVETSGPDAAPDAALPVNEHGQEPQQESQAPSLPLKDFPATLPEDEGQELLLSSDASADMDRLLAQLQADAEADAATAAAAAAASAAAVESQQEIMLSTSDSEGPEAETAEQPEVPRRRQKSSQGRVREESVYADALEVALDNPSVTRASLLPDEAMLDVLRMMGSNELGGLREGRV